jgi:hypothetical protein
VEIIALITELINSAEHRMLKMFPAVEDVVLDERDNMVDVDRDGDDDGHDILAGELADEQSSDEMSKNKHTIYRQPVIFKHIHAKL